MYFFLHKSILFVSLQYQKSNNSLIKYTAMIKEFLNYIDKNRNLSKNTIENYARDLNSFVVYAQVLGWRWSTINQHNVEEYLAFLHDCKLKPATINRRLSSLRSMLQWAYRQGILESNAARFVQSQKIDRKLPDVADEDALRRYLSTTPTTDKARTIHALVAILLETGCRLQEAIDMRICDVHAQDSSITVNGKGKKQRLVYFSKTFRQYATLMSNVRKGYLLPIGDAQQLRYMFYDELRPYTRTHPHAIRHLWASKMLKNGADLAVISHLMGHESIKTTERYLHLADNHIRQQYFQFH